MAVEYDLIVIGNSVAGVHAALTASRLKARVALVESDTSYSDWSNRLHHQVLRQVGLRSQQINQAAQLGMQRSNFGTILSEPAVVSWSQASEWAHQVVSTLQMQKASAVLAALGIEVISGTGQFYRQPKVAFVIGKRRLQARSYLLALNPDSLLPDIEGLQTVDYLTPERLSTAELSEQPRTLIVIGGNPIATELAQTFARLGSQVTMVVDAPHILVKEDPEAACLVQAQLEAEGVRILTQTRVTQMRQIQAKKWVQAGNQAIEADAILLATGQRLPLESLNLDAVGVRWNQRGVLINSKLQTTNPQIYISGSVVSGYHSSHVALLETEIALKNALFLPIFAMKDLGIPWATFSDPELARVGLTELQAKQKYSNDILVVRQFYQTNLKAQVRGETTGFCKVIVRSNGQILGVHLIAPEASELIHLFALAIDQHLKIDTIARQPCLSPTLSELLHQTAVAWQEQRLNRNPIRSSFLEGWLQLRRSWF